MKPLTDRLFRLFEVLMVANLAAMVVMVFANAVLRKLTDFDIVLFGGGIPISEEMSRICFVWLTFIGAVVVARENAHLGVDTLVAKFGDGGRKACMAVSDTAVITCCAVFFWGTLVQAPLHWSNVAPITNLNMLAVYGIGFFAALGMGLIALFRLIRIATGTLDPAELRHFAGEYDDDPAHTLKGRLE